MKFACLTLAAAVLCRGAEPAEKIAVSPDWSRVTSECRTSVTIQVVVNPPLRRGSAIHDRVFRELRALGADYVRFVPWFPYPRLGVAELEPPAGGKTFWDFSLIDPLATDFLNATAGHPVVMNFSTIPQWMWVTPRPVSYPDDPNQVLWNYTQGSELRDPTAKEVADYYARLVSWYTKGGFTDEAGQRHESGYHYRISHWEVLNEVDFEHSMSPQRYTGIYDAVVQAIRAVEPDMKFVGLGLAEPSNAAATFEYFLNPRNHKPGVPLDFISYHFYATPTPDQAPAAQQFTFFEQAERFLTTVRFAEAIRKRLSASTGVMLNELGAIAADDARQGQPGYVFKPIPDSYWNLCAALYAYLYGQLAGMGIDVAGASQLVGYPSQYPSVSLVNWETGEPNARLRVVKLLRDHFGPGDHLVNTAGGGSFVYAQAFTTRDGARRLLLVNKRDREFDVVIPEANGKTVEYVDQTTGSQPPARAKISGDTFKLTGYMVAVVEL